MRLLSQILRFIMLRTFLILTCCSLINLNCAQEINREVEFIAGKDVQQYDETKFGGRSFYVNELYGPQVSVRVFFFSAG